MPDDVSDARHRARHLALLAAGGALAGTMIVLVGGGFSLSVGGVAARAHRPWILIGVATVAAAIAVRFGGIAGVRRDLSAAWDQRDRCAPWVAALAAATAIMVGLNWGTWTAGGADAYGYVSQALLWASGHLVVPQPLAALVPGPQSEMMLSPLGYRPATIAGAIVPTYPPGLPLAMAAGAFAAGPSAVFWVVPLAGAAAIWFTYRLGRRHAGASSGAVAAVLLVASPVFLYQVVQPMSDVPVTAWWMGALLAVSAGRPGVAGGAVAAAMLTRPNLAPLAAWIALGVGVRAYRQHRAPGATLRALVACGMPLMVGLGFLLWLNTQWYGSPFASGYGTLKQLFDPANVGANLDRYPRWLVHTQTPLVAVGILAPVVAWFSVDGHPSVSRFARVLAAAFAIGFALLVFASYLLYAPFEEWSYLRFLLPALPVVLLLMTAVVMTAISKLPVSSRAPLAVLAVVALATHYVVVARDGQAFALRGLEERYRSAGAYAAAQLPSSAVFLSVQESGSLRLYSGRATLRFDFVDPLGLDRTVAVLERAGYHPYFALEAWEEAQFRERFLHASGLGLLDWPPVAEVGRVVKVRFYDPRDRARFLAGENVRTFRDARPPDTVR